MKHAHRGSHPDLKRTATPRGSERRFAMAPIALALAAGGMAGGAQAQQAFSPAWFAAKGTAQAGAAATGKLPNGMPASSLANPSQQSVAARQKLQTSINNLNMAARAIAAQQALQAQMRAEALANGESVPDGLAEGGLKVDGNSLTAGWLNAQAPAQTVANGRTTVGIQQTADKAILNWETFNVGKNTTVEFQQQKDWAILNKVNDPLARPSQIQGRIKADGTVLIANRNGVVFEGSSQVNVRNLVAAAATITDTQFQINGVYGATATTSTFTDAHGAVRVERGAQITTDEPRSVTDGGGYVMLLGTQVENAGEIVTRKGQALLAAGDRFVIRKGASSDANSFSTVRGSEIMPQFNADVVDGEGRPVPNPAGRVANSGLIAAREGDITLAGREVRQDGVAVSSSTVNARGTIHLLNSATDARARVTLGEGATTAVLLEDDGGATALDAQRDALIKESAALDQQRISAAAVAGTTGSFDNYSALADRRDLSRIEIVGGGMVGFGGGSLTLATGGQLAVTSGNSGSGTKQTPVYNPGAIAADTGAILDVSGAVGVNVAMESNNIKVNVQGNELRDAPLNRDAGRLFNRNLWVDRRDLVLVPAGTDGYESDRYYTAGGLLEVSGYLGNAGHGIGEWMAQGGSINLVTDSIVTAAGSLVNIAGGSVDVATGYVRQSWLQGADGKLYTAGLAPASFVYRGVYVGFESTSERWGVTQNYYSPIIAPQQRLENGYTVGRDAGKLEIWAQAASLAGDIDASVFNGMRQTDVRPATVSDGYKLSQTQAALAGRLVFQTWDPTLDPQIAGIARLQRQADVSLAASAPDAPSDAGVKLFWADLARINAAGLGGLKVDTRGRIVLGDDLALAPGGALNFAGAVDLQGSITARGGTVKIDVGVSAYGDALPLTVADGITIDTRGLWTNAVLDPAGAWGIAFRNGGSVSLSTFGELALESGSRIDASGGGALRTGGSTLGGNGGDISLSAGGLVIDGGGEIASYGFGKGGKLRVVTPAAISIGGTLTETRGLLAPGETAPFELTVSEAFTLPAGYTLPVTLNVSSGQWVPLGEEIPGSVLDLIGVVPQHRPVIGPNGWVVPLASPYGGNVWAIDPVTNVQKGYLTGERVPAGFIVTSFQGAFPAGYVLPRDAFTGPLYIPYPRTATYAAGTTLTADLRVRSGTVLSRGTVLPVQAKVLPTFDIVDANAFFQQGFSAYDLSGAAGLIVQPGTQMDVAMPVYRFNDTAQAQSLAGDALARAAELALPPLFAENPAKGTLRQRAGADVALTGGLPGLPLSGRPVDPLTSGALIVGENARISVDPGRGIDLTSRGQIQVEGTLSAPGGHIGIINTRTLMNVFDSYRAAHPNDYGYMPLDPTDGVSVWIGEHAVLDAAGRAYTALDAAGNPYGVVFGGGHIQLGGSNADDPFSTGVLSSSTYVVVRDGAEINADGASAIIGVGAATGRERKEVATDGGSITISSYSGFFLDGNLHARAGGAGTRGGALDLLLESAFYPNVTDLNARPARILTLTQDWTPQLSADLQVGQEAPAFTPGRARVSAAQIQAGGFDSLTLMGRSAIVFDGDVTLDLGKSLTLSQGALHNSREDGRVSLSAPHVFFDGGVLFVGDYNSQRWGLPTGGTEGLLQTGSRLDVAARLIDAEDTTRIFYADTVLDSAGDLRLLPATGAPLDAGLNGSSTRLTALRAQGNLGIVAAQIYPVTNAVAEIAAGSASAPATLSLSRSTVELPALPYSVFGALNLNAAIIEQGGVLRAPFGNLTLVAGKSVRLLPGSVTSISTRDLVIPMGGTVDGVSYQLNGADIPPADLITGQYAAPFTFGGQPQISGTLGLNIDTPSLTSEAGSLLDVSGGGYFAGGAFVTGRGGSVDTLLAPLNPGGRVYAIVPGAQAAVAPPAGGYYAAWTGAVPEPGQQITIPEGVAGLPAGIYTLMPANYALLPGAWRVELGATGARHADPVKLPNGSYTVSGSQGNALTGLADSLNTAVTLTDGAMLRTWSNYNETGYSAFQQRRTALFGTLRPQLEADGGQFRFTARAKADAPANSALVWHGATDFSAAEGGYAGHFMLTAAPGGAFSPWPQGRLVITGESGGTGNDANTITVAARDLDALAAPNLWLGGTPVKDYNAPNISLRGNVGNSAAMVQQLVLEEGVNLTAGQIVLGANNRISLREGVTLNTLGQGRSWLDSRNGLFFGAVASTFGSYATLLVSNGEFTLDAPSGLFGSNIELADGVKLYSEGSIGFYSDLGVSITGTPTLGTRNLSLAVPSFNIGTDEVLAAVLADRGPLPAGMNLNQRMLDTLFAGNPAAGVPSVQSLSLSAAQSINFFGSVELDTLDPATGRFRLGQLVLNSPAIYGYGETGDVVRLTADTLVWNNTQKVVDTANSSSIGNDTRYFSANPGALLAGGTGAGMFQIDANAIVLGNPTPAKPDTSIAYHRLLLGFADVNFNAAERITGNAKGTLSVYQGGADPGAGRFDPETYQGNGGNLHLNTPLLTGEAGSVIAYRAGGALDVTAPAGSAPAANAGIDIGATLALRGHAVEVASDVLLPSGKLTLTADQDVTLAGGSLLDVSGRRLTFFDVTRDSWGGDVDIVSLHGNIVQHAGSTIDVSADETVGADAGSLRVTALDAAKGRIQLQGTLAGAGGEGHANGGFQLAAQHIGDRATDLSADFAALNTMLTAAGFTGERAFALKQGNLSVGDEIKAQAVTLSVDGGSLTVNGRIDASGQKPGSIRLAARDDLRLTGGAVLDAHGTVLQVDSHGQAIEAKNRGIVELTSAQGWLRLDDGSTLDVSAPGVGDGRVTLNARRASETGGEVLIDAAGRVNVRGARSIAVNGFWTYAPTDAAGSIVQDNTADNVPAGALGLDQIDAQNRVFYANAQASTVLQARLAGLKAYGDAYHLRPGVEIISSEASGGKLTVKGDLNLAGYRYGPRAVRNPDAADYGAGEPLALVVRAEGDLAIHGSITDGFGLPKRTPDDSPLLLQAGKALTGDYTLPEGVTLATGSKLGAGAILPMDVELRRAQVLPQGQAAPETIILGVNYVDQWGSQIGSIFGGLNAWGELLQPVTVVAGRVDDWNYNGWTFGPGETFYYPLGAGATIHAGTILSAASSGYADLLLKDGAKIMANRALPQPVKLGADYALAAAMTATGRIVTPGRTFEIGDLIPAGTALPSGSTIGAGAALPFDFYIDAITWQAGNPLVLAGGYTLGSGLALAAGTVLPAGTMAAGNVYATSRRPVWAVAPMLAAGSESASLRLVGGADLAAADTRALASSEALAGRGNVTLSDERISASTSLPIFSVLRTGTGDLDILAGGSLSQGSPFGVYTAGTQSNLASGNEAYMLPRASLTGLPDYDAALEQQVLWFPDHGGDFLLVAQGDVSGYQWTTSSSGGLVQNDVAAWLWRQGADGMGHATAWGVNFGTYAAFGAHYDADTRTTIPHAGVVGFQGFGALGGGNVTLLAGGDAGLLSPSNPYVDTVSGGLVLAVGATGRVTEVTKNADGGVTGGTLVQTGGGDLTLKIGGGLNAAQASVSSAGSMNGKLVDLRGDISISAAQIGSLARTWGTTNGLDPRAADNYTAYAVRNLITGPVLVPGDGTVSVRTRGDLVLSGWQDAGMVQATYLQGGSFASPDIYSFAGSLLDNPARTGVDRTWFSLWTPDTAVALFSAGGQLVPFNGNQNQGMTYSQVSYLPGQFRAVAGSGSIYYGSELSNSVLTYELLPAPTGQLELLAADSIHAAARSAGARLGLSGARTGVNELPNPFKPGWVMAPLGFTGDLVNFPLDPACVCGTNTLVSIGPPAYEGGPSRYFPKSGYFAFQAADAPTGALHAADPDPVRLYAVGGDIIGLVLGGYQAGNRQTGTAASWLLAKATQVRAGEDIVGFGVWGTGVYEGVGSYLMNANATDVSIIEAGGDIFYANVKMAGPGTLEITTGGNFYQGNQGSIQSIGSVIPGDTRPGAGIVAQVGFNATGADWAALAALYLDPSRQADIVSGLPLASQPGKVAHTYQKELASWLGERFGYAAADSTDALAYFAALPAEQQRIFLREVYYAELLAGGREYNDKEGPRFQSYLRGRQAIATLFPEADAEGRAIARRGDYTAFGAAGIQTQFGGGIQALVPGGQIIVGVQGEPPPATSGLITQGDGDIQLYSQGSILLGLSRIMTTFGGGILAWSAEGDINAGRGSKTTLVYTPPKRVYDDVGNVVLSPQVPSTGAGIATLNPIPEVPPGDVDLIAPLGTIDAGEAGIRVSGNANLAALRVVNAENIQVQGKATGLPVAATVNVSALTNASQAASAAATAAQDVMQRERAAVRQNLPSIFTVRVVGFGNEPSTGGERPPSPAPGARSDATRYDPRHRVQVVGHGQNFNPELLSRLTPEQLRLLKQDR